MRELIIARIQFLIADSTFSSTRWSPVGSYLYQLSGKDPESKAGRKAVKEFLMKDFDLTVLSDRALMEVFELTLRRFYIQM